ncbi:unnamed protein product [Fusarium equiseti]|uniref:Uncharacterized protein n=1 Tax=Fusarium equiseti TaxID=61235 RepID=A0A8J2IM75_FUSEQ|nr:unnamed protein product [Fusarium equiseti]
MAANLRLPSPSQASKFGFLAVGTAFVLFALSAFYTDSIRSPLDYVTSKASDSCRNNIEPRNCRDPYRRPGYLIIPPNGTDYRETQWMPFTETFLNAEAPETAAYPPKGELIFNDTAVPKRFLEGPEIPRQWMKIATEENRRRIEALKHIKNPTVDDFAAMKDEGGLGWLWGQRWKKLWKLHENPINGPRGRPDLIFFQNGLWDQRGFQVGGQKHHQDDNSTLVATHRKMTWDELHFFSVRLRLFLQRLEKEFPDTPMMWRSLTFHRKTGSKDLMLIEMDRYGRALAEQHGHEVFEWARI